MLDRDFALQPIVCKEQNWRVAEFAITAQENLQRIFSLAQLGPTGLELLLDESSFLRRLALPSRQVEMMDLSNQLFGNLPRQLGLRSRSTEAHDAGLSLHLHVDSGLQLSDRQFACAFGI